MLLKNYLFTLVLGSTSIVFAQKNDKSLPAEKSTSESSIEKSKKSDKNTDTSSVNLSSVNLKLDALLNLMNSKVIPFIDDQNSDQNKVHEDEVAQLKVTISELKASDEAKQKLIDLSIEEKKKSDADNTKLKDQVKSNSDVLLKQKEQLRLEIGALQKQSFKINEAILNSLGERLKITPGVEASWSQTYQDFKVKQNLLSQADEFLSKPYDVKVNQLIDEINTGFSLGQQFAELTKEKIVFITLLSGYCEKSEEMKSLLNSVSKLNDFKEERDKKINNTMYYYVGYDYLISIIQKNKTDFNYNPIKNTVINCN